MSFKLSKNQIERYSRQIVIKNIGALGQQKIIRSNILIIGMGGLGCPVAELLVRAGVGNLGIVDFDKVSLSNLHRQTLYDNKDLNKFKVEVAKKKLNKINSKSKISIYKTKINKKNLEKIIKDYKIVIDGSDNFQTKFLVNDFCIKLKKFLVTGAISKFDGHIFTFNFNNKTSPCLRCFFQEEKISEEILNCEYDGILGSVAGTIGSLQANEALKYVLDIGKNSNNYILILDLLNLNFRKVRLNKRKMCLCN
tara:strand:+ start:3907 stop:4662 length:756 start_codon:yes stop_codon:yes gene_type:complete